MNSEGPRSRWNYCKITTFNMGRSDGQLRNWKIANMMTIIYRGTNWSKKNGGKCSTDVTYLFYFLVFWPQFTISTEQFASCMPCRIIALAGAYFQFSPFCMSPVWSTVQTAFFAPVLKYFALARREEIGIPKSNQSNSLLLFICTSVFLSFVSWALKRFFAFQHDDEENKSVQRKQTGKRTDLAWDCRHRRWKKVESAMTSRVGLILETFFCERKARLKRLHSNYILSNFANPMQINIMREISFNEHQVIIFSSVTFHLTPCAKSRWNRAGNFASQQMQKSCPM